MACISPCIWGGGVTVLYPFRRLTSSAWMIVAGCGILFLASSVSACLTVAQVGGNMMFQGGDPKLIVLMYQGLNVIYKLAACLLVLGMWRSLRDLRGRVDMLSDVVERGGNEVPEGDFHSGF
ncbi:MAG: hypothetical protein H8E37_13515 [Planctomycetes bacterium]|nr:hypothetical protein [Planctomycetota bacterium]